MAGSAESARPPILFIHGLNFQGDCWHEIAATMADRLCVMPDLRVHGGSHAEGPFGIDTLGA
jgi:pimeloyl-ACP methyl ester carboxylesterase